MMPGAGQATLTQADRLKAYYSDLETGRFTVIADFEQTRQMELFRSVSRGGTALHRLSLSSGVPATGGRCLHAAFGQPEDELIADGSEARQWHLPRDWREYDLLMMSVHTPAPVDLRLSVASGEGKLRSIADSSIPLQAGWNLLRLDLADAMEHVALDDIRELRWSLPEISRPTLLLIDDVILANNQIDLFGDSRTENGRLYLRRRGRRWDIGAGGRFELGLTNGQIRYWYDVAEDRLRVRNLVEGTVLGPTVVSLTGGEDFAVPVVESFPVWGDRVVTRQRLLEASPTRMVVACQWDFVPPREAATTDLPRQQWTYTIYPTGEVYVHLECSTETQGWAAGNLGLAVSRRDSDPLNLLCHSTAQLGDTGRLLHVPYAFAGHDRPGGPDLLFVVHDGRSAPLMKCFREGTLPRVTAVAFGGQTHKPTQEWDCLLSLGLSDTEIGPAGASRALYYCFPPTLTPTVGSLVTESEGDRDHDGFNERFGCYMLAPQDRRVLLTLDGKSAPLYNPAFLVQGSTGMESWVYVDYVVLHEVSRTAAGEVVFQIPGLVDTRRTVEVYLRNPGEQGRR
ncbi:MAG: hypothetical protein V2A79_17160 [Planctomycetota bacterium]